MHKENYDIKRLAESKGIKMWQIADVYGLHESNFCRLMRHPLLPSDRARIVKIINDLSNEV